MQWVTRDHIHFDRVASPWLIKRFVDPDAQFVLVPWNIDSSSAPAGAIPFALPGAELGPHDETGSTFRKIAHRYDLLADPAIRRMCDIVDKGVAFVLEGYRPDREDQDGQIAVGLLEVSEGMMLIDGDDYDNMRASFPMYDALYRSLSARARAKRDGVEIPKSGPDGPSAKVQLLRGLLRQAPSHAAPGEA